MSTRIYMKQRPPSKMSKMQRLNFRENPLSGIQWANWGSAIPVPDPEPEVEVKTTKKSKPRKK